MITELIPQYFESIPKPIEPGILYISEKYGCAQHICPCGCGDVASVSFGPDWDFVGDNWTLTKHDNGTVTLHASLLNRGCKAHYWVRENKIVWCE